MAASLPNYRLCVREQAGGLALLQQAGDHLSPEEEQRLFKHYGVGEEHQGDVIVLTRIVIVGS
jgi:hypothetical protein